MEKNNTLIRGTTPTMEFELPFDTNIISQLYVTITQCNKIIIDKDIESCFLDGNFIKCRLTQEDTLALSAKREVEIQIRVLTNAGDALASIPITESVTKILKEGVIE